MIVGKYFAGDDDTEIAWKQHDVYGQALSVIIQTCNNFTLFAKSLLNDKAYPDWGAVTSCDHRSLQFAHDILAAAWRFEFASSREQLWLEGQQQPLASHTPEALWLRWLHAEIEGWIFRPELVRYIQLILTMQNTSIENAAESRLCLALVDRFTDVPWTPHIREAHVNNLERLSDPMADLSQNLQY